MTRRTPTRRSYARRFRQVYVTTTRRERTPETFARILTNTALGRAQLEAGARADHQARLALDCEPSGSGWQTKGEGARDA
jgi:hypothetical protein